MRDLTSYGIYIKRESGLLATGQYVIGMEQAWDRGVRFSIDNPSLQVVVKKIEVAR